ncbi:NAD(P)/FAD-dependent oxidoreductase [Bacillus piscicola]|uniref:NAD(P)/FAD-dependent oxidoreductase n=1 Tax=Bacillus piscicola TaxID=1632684 RepID=UPI001F08B1E3|nr:FAD-dependent oxidoreductase [Bacillus piscicola]
MTQKIVVIGGGIIGLSSAYYLKKRGYDVTVIDKGIPGEGCSAGNMGWICPTLSEPVPAPGLVQTSLKWMLQRDSPLYIKPTKVPAMTSWLYKFWRHCNKHSYESGYKAMRQLSKNSLPLFNEMEEDGDVNFELHQKGLLFLFTEEEAIKAKYEKLKVITDIGHPIPEIKSREEVAALEPTVSEDVVGGLYLPAERHVRPESYLQGMLEWLKRHDVEIKANTPITKIKKKNGEVKEVRCGRQVIEGDAFLITAGVWSAELVKELNVKLPMTAGKGYSITITEPNIQVSNPLYLGNSKIGISPYQHAVRIAGTMELSGINGKIDQKRVQGLRHSVQKYFSTPIEGKERVWTGMRPMTPDGLPVLGKVPDHKNVFIATGHAMSGISMSLSTGKLMSDLIAGAHSPCELSPFSLTRFQ